ncbi:hypothetical protein BpHYR1_041665 [Brachionus plicatilis]|uniref:Uncharacterized protein n=1 Tax=Brachionus plicatilis TaxID=10195 RepID=A0A3M7STV2_BRAPC|nr:hypothetical protein BpHYR1_041665 [Brachionus plicatilis]
MFALNQIFRLIEIYLSSVSIHRTQRYCYHAKSFIMHNKFSIVPKRYSYQIKLKKIIWFKRLELKLRD